MDKWKQLLVVAFLVGSSAAPEAALAASMEQAKQKDVAMLLSAASGRNSAYRASLIGETEVWVYIEYLTAIHASGFWSRELKRIVYWLPRSEITDEQLTQLKIYKDKFRTTYTFRRGMTPGEVAAAVKSLGLTGLTAIKRPDAGWAQRDGTLENMQGQAYSAESMGQRVAVVERYPVEHVLSGAGTLYLFYGPDGKLLQHHEHQTN
jgi:hypothetical protein